jgi:hypothetical protein
MELFDKFYIAEHLVPAIINGDWSGLADVEEQHLKWWLGERYIDVQDEFGDLPYHYQLVAEASDNFRECDVCELLAHCCTLAVYVHTQAGSNE